MLVIVKNRDVHASGKQGFNLETLWSIDILYADSAKGRGKKTDRLNNFIHLLGFKADREGVNICKCLENDRFSLKNRHGCQWPLVAEPEDTRAICDQCDGITATGIVEGCGRVFFNCPARLGNTRGIDKT